MTELPVTGKVSAGVLSIAFHSAGPADGPPVLLMHGFPYDVHAYADVVPILAGGGCRVVVPNLRGFGPRVSCATTPRARASRPPSAPTCSR